MRRLAAIMAGGGGTRFWPLSRQETPKQLIKLTSDSVMINDTIDHFAHLVSRQDTFIVTNCAQYAMMDDVVYPEVSRNNILREPLGRNTAPCILYAAMVMKKVYGDAMMAVLPADHHIADLAEYERVLGLAFQVAEDSSTIVTIGIWPSFASTGYGYIRFSDESISPHSVHAHQVERFVEKPTQSRALEYLNSGRYLWNSGMFIWKVSVILEHFKKMLPEMYDAMEGIYDSLRTDEEQSAINEIYPSLQSISIDYGIMEKASNMYVIPAEFGWNDVGSWDALSAVFQTDDDNNVVRANHVGIGTENCIIHGNQDKLITTVGVDNLIIVDTGDALLVCHRGHAQEVRKIVEELKKRRMTGYL